MCFAANRRIAIAFDMHVRRARSSSARMYVGEVSHGRETVSLVRCITRRSAR
jgi:hypothetical protein